MSKLAIYPGSFNPFHNGHLNVLTESVKVFDKIIISVGVNPDKKPSASSMHEISDSIYEKINGQSLEFIDSNKYGYYSKIKLSNSKTIEVMNFKGLLKDFVTLINANVIIKGLRNTNDFIYEQNQQYINEDLGIKIPVYYVISNRHYIHYSSSAFRAIKQFTK